ncbi:MAG: ABC transporter ATP-binding protein [Candidatus Baldrarchaeia archaeon]
MDKKYLLEVQNLSTYFYLYEGTLSAVDDVSFRIRREEIFGLVGESGSGKSTIALSIMRLVPDPGKIVDGKIFLEGLDILSLPEKEMERIRGRKIAMITQQAISSLNPLMKVGDQIARVFKVHENIDKKEAWEKAIDMLRKVRIPEAEKVARKYPHQLSGGMCERVMIGLMLAAKPVLLIADEPTTGLDATIQAQIRGLIKDLVKDYGMSLLLITHDMGLVAKLCQSVAVMHAGHIVEIAEVNELWSNPLHPYTQGLLNAIPRPDKNIERLESINGTVPSLLNPPRGCRFVQRCPFSMQKCYEEKPKMIEIRSNHFVQCHLMT